MLVSQNQITMRLKYCTLASSLFSFALLSQISLAQNASPSPPKAGYIRIWQMSPSTAGYEVHKVAPAGATGTSLSATAYQCSSYLEFPVAKYQLGVFNKGSDKPLKVFNIDLKVDTYFTILISPESIDLFDDTNDPKAKSATLTVRNYFVGSGISISTGSGVTSGSIVYGHAVQMPRFPLDVVRVALKAALPGGKQTASDLDVDFKHNSRATLLIMPDSYGRFRTRLIFDGKNL
jgi:hypothetical protein